MNGAKSIAEYAIRVWLQNQGFDMRYFELTMNGEQGILNDKNGSHMVLGYENESHTVFIKE